MKKLAAGIAASLLLATSLPAFADRFGPGPHDGPPPPVRHHHRGHGGYGSPLVWGVAGLALGSVLYSISAPPPVVVAPPAMRPPERLWYYCESYRAYYPNVQYCPEGWRTIPAY